MSGESTQSDLPIGTPSEKNIPYALTRFEKPASLRTIPKGPPTREELLEQQKQAELDRVTKQPKTPTQEELVQGVKPETLKTVKDWKG